MKTFTNIDASRLPYDARPGMASLQASPPQMYGNPAVQAHYEDAYRPVAQKAAMDLGRANTMAAGQYASKANAAQNEAVLAGLGLLGKQQQNAYQRQQAQESMAYGWMNDMMRGSNSILGGLL